MVSIVPLDESMPHMEGLEQYIDQQRLLECARLMELPVVKRVMQVKTAELFGRIDPDRFKVKEDYMTRSRGDADKDIFANSFSLTMEPGGRPVEPEFKYHVAIFMMDALWAMDAFGFIPWKVSKVLSQTMTNKVITTITVPQFGMWRVRQMLKPGDSMERVYQLQPYNGPGSSSSMPFNLLPYDNDEAGMGGRERPADGETPKERLVFQNVNNGARDFDALHPYKKPERGVFMLEEPTTKGWPRSTAMTALPICQRIGRLWEYTSAAAAVAADPMLVTGTPSASERQGPINAATSYYERSDLARMRAQNREEMNARIRASTRRHDRAQAAEAEAGSKMHSYYDPITGERMLMSTKPFYDQHHYTLQPGEQIFSQPLPQAPQALEAKERQAYEQVASLFGVNYSQAVSGEHGRLAANAEANQNVLDAVTLLQGNKLAAATEWILNHVFHELDTETFTDELKLQTDLVRVLEEEINTGENADNENVNGDPAGPDVTDEKKEKKAHKMEKLGREKERAKYLKQMIDAPARYRIKFPDRPPNTETIQLLAQRGLIDRKTEAALIASSAGISMDFLSLQQGPSSFEKATLKATADAKASAAEKRSKASGSKESKQKKKKASD